MINVNSSTTTLTFTAPSLPDGVFNDTVVVMVTAINQYGVGSTSDPATAEINSIMCNDVCCIIRLCVYVA